MDISLINAQDMAKANPTTFHCPSDKSLNNLKIGDYVKLCDGKERFWVEITSITDMIYQGRISNLLVSKQTYNIDAIVKFKQENVYDIYNNDFEALQQMFQALAFKNKITLDPFTMRMASEN